MAEILLPSTFFQDVLTFKISALYHFFFQSYNTFCWWISNFSEIDIFPWLSLYNSESTSDYELKFWMSKHIEKMCLETKFQAFLFINNRDKGWATWPSCDPLDVPLTVRKSTYKIDSIQEVPTPKSGTFYTRTPQINIFNENHCHRRRQKIMVYFGFSFAADDFVWMIRGTIKRTIFTYILKDQFSSVVGGYFNSNFPKEKKSFRGLFTRKKTF